MSVWIAVFKNAIHTIQRLVVYMIFVAEQRVYTAAILNN